LKKNHPPSNHELDIISEKIRAAIIKTIGLKDDEKVFIGNEAQLFLLLIFQKMPDSAHPTSVKFSNYQDQVYFKMLDIANDELLKRVKVRKLQNIKEQIRLILIRFRGLLIKLKHLFTLNYKLKQEKKIIHYAAHMRYGNFVVPNLTDLYFKGNIKKNVTMRKVFSQNLIEVGLENTLVEYLSFLFPTSHLELYNELSNHPLITNKIETVVTSIYGLMDDPLLSFLIKNNNSQLIYVQHGGGYGLYKNHQVWQIEEGGADKMYYWGTGDHNVYPTRYRNQYFSRINSEICIILEDKKDNETIKPFIELSEFIDTNLKKRCVVVAHPNGPTFEHNNIQKGIGYRQHEKAQLIVYDRITQSLIYARILSKRPFLILEENEQNITMPGSDNAYKFISLLREVGILIKKEDLNEKVEYWAKLSSKEATLKFNEIAQPFLEHVLGQPKIESVNEL
jgi:hypothetical protein